MAHVIGRATINYQSKTNIMKVTFLFPLLVATVIYTGCSSGSKDEPAYRSNADTTSSQVNTPSTDTLIKDTVLKDSTIKSDNPTPASKTKSDDKDGTTNR